jgi:rubrerythrin
MQATAPNRLLRPLYWVIWLNAERRSRKLLQFSEVEASGGRDLVRAAELTQDARLRRLFLAHARDEERHARMFRARGLALQEEGSRASGKRFLDGIGSGERGLDDLRVEDEDMHSLLAFIHLSERAAAREFATYRAVLSHDPQTQALFERILHDEESHMNYSLAELNRVSPGNGRGALWKARLRRVWRSYLRLAAGLANIISTVLLVIQYFILIPPFALAAKLSARREKRGWQSIGAAAVAQPASGAKP